MASVNLVVLLGNVTRDIEVKFLQSGMAVCDIGLAVNNRRKNANGEWIEEPCFVDCTAFGKTAECAGNYLAKGRQVHITGHLVFQQWESQDGQKRSKLKVIVDNLTLVGGKPDGQQGGGQGNGGSRQPRGNSAAHPPEDNSYGGQGDAPSGGGSGGDDIPFSLLLPFILASAMSLFC